MQRQGLGCVLQSSIVNFSKNRESDKSNVCLSHISDRENDKTLSNYVTLAIAKLSLEYIRIFIEQNNCEFTYGFINKMK
ncbi:hypothetical protein HZS_5568 [Henneguya salminicola]|nr:hypothetical protein HZS_5568 [Henneguya salminicola]